MSNSGKNWQRYLCSVHTFTYSVLKIKPVWVWRPSGCINEMPESNLHLLCTVSSRRSTKSVWLFVFNHKELSVCVCVCVCVCVRAFAFIYLCVCVMSLTCGWHPTSLDAIYHAAPISGAWRDTHKYLCVCVCVCVCVCFSVFVRSETWTFTRGVGSDNFCED